MVQLGFWVCGGVMVRGFWWPWLRDTPKRAWRPFGAGLAWDSNPFVGRIKSRSNRMFWACMILRGFPSFTRHYAKDAPTHPASTQKPKKTRPCIIKTPTGPCQCLFRIKPCSPNLSIHFSFVDIPIHISLHKSTLTHGTI